MHVKHLLLVSFFLFTSLLPAQEILNLTLAKNAVSQYYTSGKYDKELDAVVDSAILKLRQVKIQPGAAAVFDVDETTLSNLPHMMSLDWGYDFGMWNKWVMDGMAKAIPQVKSLYDTLVARGVKIIFLTGRMDEYHEATKSNLIAAGYKTFDTLITRHKNEKYSGVANYKETMRCALESRGYHIIMCVGDQQTDLQGSCAGIKVKIPNYVYIID